MRVISTVPEHIVVTREEHMLRRISSISFPVLALAVNAIGQESARFPVFVTGSGDAGIVARSLNQRLKGSMPFVAATEPEASKVAVLISCMSRASTDPFLCMYVSFYMGASISKTFLGSGLFVGTSAEAVSSNFLGSIAQDIADRFDNTANDSLRQALESCLALTDFKCRVPPSLRKELDAATLTLEQYLKQK